MSNVIEGQYNTDGMRLGIVTSRFNEFITSKLLEGAKDCFLRHGGHDDSIDISWVPGAFEIPLMAKKMAVSQRYDAIICIGAVIRGSTPHFDYVASEVSKGVAQISLENEIPISFGVLTTDTLEQAIERAGSKAGNKGWEAALTAIEMFNLLKKFD